MWLQGRLETSLFLVPTLTPYHSLSLPHHNLKWLQGLEGWKETAGVKNDLSYPIHHKEAGGGGATVIS